MAPSRPTVPPVDQLQPTGDPLTFLQPVPPSPSPSDLPTEEATETSGPEPVDPWPSDPAESATDAGEPKSPARGSSKGSSQGEPAAAEVIGALTQTAVIVSGEMLHDTFARDRAARAVGMWLTDSADATNIGDPLASIINRHNPISGVVENTDAGDAIAALAGLGVYLFHQLDKWRQARRLRRQALPGSETVTVEPDEPADVRTEPAPGPFGLS